MGIKYNKFLRSEWWKDLRQRKLGNKNVCDVCKSYGKLHIHHFNYRYKYSGSVKRAIQDTKVLCSKCHYEFHKRFGVKKDMTKEMHIFLWESKKDLDKAYTMYRQWEKDTEWIKNII